MSLLLSQLVVNPGDGIGVCTGAATVIGVGLAIAEFDGVGTCAAFATVIGVGDDAATMPDTQGGSRHTVRTRSLSVSTRFWPVPDYNPY